jgi:hypothetical protein
MTDEEIGTRVLEMFRQAWAATGGPAPASRPGDRSNDVREAALEIPADLIRSDPARGWDTVRVRLDEVIKRAWRCLNGIVALGDWVVVVEIVRERWHGPFFGLVVELHRLPAVARSVATEGP